MHNTLIRINKVNRENELKTKVALPNSRALSIRKRNINSSLLNFQIMAAFIQG